MVDQDERWRNEICGLAEYNCYPSFGRQIMEGELEETTFEGEREDDFGGSWDDERSGSEGRGRYYRSKSYSALRQGPLPMATTPPLSPELLERGQARCKAEFSRSNTWDRLAAAGLYAVSLWKVSQELIEEKAKVLIDGPVGKLKEATPSDQPH
ncbi:unnamed protein product [Calypogeia fissa]